MALTSRFIRAHALAQLLIGFSALRSLSVTASFHQEQQYHGHTFGKALQQLHPRSLTTSFTISPQAHAHDTQVGSLRNQMVYTLAFIAQALLPLLLVIWLQFYAGRSLGVLSATAFKASTRKRSHEQLSEKAAERKEAVEVQRSASSDQASKPHHHLLTPFTQPLTASPTTSPSMAAAVNEGQEPVSPLAPLSPLSPRSSLKRFHRHKKSHSASQIYIAEEMQRPWTQTQAAVDLHAPLDAPFLPMGKETAKERKSD